MSAPFRRIAVIGLGLLGGSVALAARARGVAESVVGSGRRLRALEEAERQGVIDAALPVEEVARGADLVVLATPVGVMEEMVRRAAGSLAPGTLVTDVGSVKAPVADTLPGLLPPGVAYVGAHPMAGSHRRGVEHARADLFEAAPCVVTPTPETDPAAAERIEAFWRGLGARIVRRDPAAHDRDVAWTSHVPHVLAFAFVRAFGDAPEGAADVAGSGFRDFTRIARSDAEMWSEILTANRKAVAGPLQRVAERLAELARALESGDGEAVERALAQGRELLARIPSPDFDARSGGENPEIQASERGHKESDNTNS